MTDPTLDLMHFCQKNRSIPPLLTATISPMSETAATAPPPTRSTLYVIFSAVVAALIIGLTLFLLLRGLQWRAALSDLRAEPGIEILSTERVGFFKKRLRGLRDPLAPAAESILVRHGIGPWSCELALAEYHSLNTPYAAQRAADEAARYEGLRDSLIKAVGDHAESLAKQREADLEKITQMLFEARFPEAMKSVKLEWREGAWFVKGELYAPDREAFMAESPGYVVSGELDFSGLIDLTATRGAALRNDIESTNLLATDPDGKLAHIDRVKRLVSDYDEVCERSRLPLPTLRLELQGPPSPAATGLKSALTTDGPEENRFLPDATLPGTSPESSAKLALVLTSQP